MASLKDGLMSGSGCLSVCVEGGRSDGDHEVTVMCATKVHSRLEMIVDRYLYTQNKQDQYMHIGKVGRNMYMHTGSEELRAQTFPHHDRIMN